MFFVSQTEISKVAFTHLIVAALGQSEVSCSLEIKPAIYWLHGEFLPPSPLSLPCI